MGDTEYYKNAKVVLVGDHSVGKSALGYRLIHGAFKEQASTHGQRFWVFPALGSGARTGRSARRSSGTSRASPTTGWSTRCSWMTPTWRWCCSMPPTSATRCTASISGSSNSKRGKALPDYPRGRSDGSREQYADAGGAGCVLPSAWRRGSDRDERLHGPGHRRTGRTHEVHDPLGGQGRDGHDHDLQADQGLRPRSEGSGIGRPDHRHARRNSAAVWRPPMPTGVLPTPKC